MNWISQIEKRKLLIVGGILLVTFSALIVTGLRSPVANDPFWHLQMGKDWLENGLSPFIDHYSFTYNGHTIASPPFVFQVLLHLAVSEFGILTGFQVLRFGFFLLTLGAVFLSLRQMKAPAFVYAIVVPMIVFLLQVRAIVRPELFSYTLSIVALMLYFRAGNKISTRNLIPMVALMLMWGNYHSSILGYVIFFGFFLDCAIAQLESHAPQNVWVKWLAWGGLLLVVGFLNPDFSHSLVQIFTLSPEWKNVIQEYQSPVSAFKSIPGFYALILLALLMPIMAYQQRRFGLLVVWAVFAYSAATMQRMLTPSGIVIVMLFAYLLVNNLTSQKSNLLANNQWSKSIGFVLLISIGATLYSNVERARYFMQENQSMLGRYPFAMVEYMKKQQISGRIFNDFGLGGYLIYRLSPQNQVYIDGRTQILYPFEHMKKHEEIENTRVPRVLRAELDKYSIDQIIWRYTQAKHDLVQEMGGFGLDFLDARYVLYTRGRSNFPLLGELLSRPECWHPGMLEELIAERQKMDEILPVYSGLIPFADLVIGYSIADDGKAFFDASIEGVEWFDEMRRFAGFRFLETGYFDLAAILFGGLTTPEPMDYFASALANIKVANYQLASQLIEEYSSIQWSRTRSEDSVIHYQLYQLLELQKSLTPGEQKQVGLLTAQLAEIGYSDLATFHALDFKAFCKL